MFMKKIVIAGIMVCIFLLIWISRFDRAEGATVRFLGFPALFVCFLFYLEALKDEIIQALRNTPGPNLPD